MSLRFVLGRVSRRLIPIGRGGAKENENYLIHVYWSWDHQGRVSQ